MSVRLDSGGDDLGEMHEINVTPFIDVMLVLLIIFMVAAPLATVDVPVDLPAATAAPSARQDEPVYLSLLHDRALVLGDRPVTADALIAELDAATRGDKETRIHLRGDKAVAYGALMEVLDTLRGAGYLKIALVGLEGG